MKRIGVVEENHGKDEASNVWHVWRTLLELPESPLLRQSEDSHAKYAALIQETAVTLRRWAEQWAGQTAFQGILNKKGFYHEIEESIVAMYLLQEVVTTTPALTSLTVLDLCCGKGIFSLVLSHVGPKIGIPVTEVVMADKAPIDWSHVEAMQSEAVPVRLLPHFNIFDNGAVADLLQTHKSKDIAFVGIHLCRGLSPRCVSIFNTRRERLSYLILAPCCLPQGTVEVHVAISTTSSSHNCYVCGAAAGHSTAECPTLPRDDDGMRKGLLRHAALRQPCWQCGERGHQKKDCPNKGKGSLACVLPASPSDSVRKINVEEMKHRATDGTNPFEEYCKALAGTVSSGGPSEAQLRVIPLPGRSNHRTSVKDLCDTNWNQYRKCTWIVAKK